MDHNVPDRRPRQAAGRSDLGEADGRARAQLRRVRHPALRDARPRARHRARHRSRAGPHAAGHDHRVRRQPHLDARRVRRAGVRHRHERGRARARHADAAADAAGDDGDHRRRRGALERVGQGHRARDHRPHRHRRRHRLRDRVPRLGDPRACRSKGRPDRLQHVDRRPAPAPASSPPTTRRSHTSKGGAFAPKGAEWERALDDWRAS